MFVLAVRLEPRTAEYEVETQPLSCAVPLILVWRNQFLHYWELCECIAVIPKFWHGRIWAQFTKPVLSSLLMWLPALGVKWKFPWQIGKNSLDYYLKLYIYPSNLENTLESIQLKKPNQVYFELYVDARKKAKEAKKNAILAYLEVKNIKKTYMIDNTIDSDSDFDAEIDEVSESELENL